MERREFFQKSAVTVAGAVAGLSAISSTASAQDASDTYAVTADISNNHGHEVALTVADVIDLLREANLSGLQSLDIQGSSRHPHTLQLSYFQLVTLLTTGEVFADTSTDGGHSHEVLLFLQK